MTSDQIRITITIRALRKLDPLIAFLELCNENKNISSLRFGCSLDFNENHNSTEPNDNLPFTSFLSLKDVVNGEIKWEDSNKINYTMSYTNFKRSFHKGVKLYVFKSQYPDATAQEVGWAIIDFQTLEEDCSNNSDECILSQWSLINGAIHGSEININLKFEPLGISSNSLEDSNTKQVEQFTKTFPVEEDYVSLSTSIKGLPIGNGKDMFLLTIKLNEEKNLQSIMRSNHFNDTQSEIWLSYAIFDVIIQTDKFLTKFSPVVDMFRLQSSIQELMTHFKNNQKTLEIHICTNGAILGSINCDMWQLFDVNKISKHPIHGFFSVNNDGKLSTHVSDDELKSDQIIAVSLTILLQELPKSKDLGIASPSKTKQSSMQKDKSNLVSPQKEKKMRKKQDGLSDRSNVKSHDGSKDREDNALREKISLNNSIIEEESSQNETRKIEEKSKAKTDKLLADLEKSKKEWEEWKQKEEIKWQAEMKEKEMLALRALREQGMIKERESTELIEAARIEQKKLEARLRKALFDVEDRERRLIVEDEKRKIEYRSNLSEIHMQQKIMKEETKHLLDLEKSKVVAAINRATFAEKSISIAEKRYQKIEEEFENYRTKSRRTPEAALQQEIMTLKAQLGDSEAKMERERTEKHQVLLEKEQLQNKIQSLIRTVNREREKNAARERSERENLRLECMAREQRILIDGDRSELQRIKDELKNLSQIGENMCRNPKSRTSLSRATNAMRPLKSPYNCQTPGQERNRDRDNSTFFNT